MAAPSGFNGITQGPLVGKDGRLTAAGLYLFQDWNTRLTNGLNQIGQLIGEINAQTEISGRAGGIGAALQNLDVNGVTTDGGVDFTRSYVNKSLSNIGGVATPAQLPPATPADQGAVQLPVGAVSNTLGDAALQPSTAFDPAGAAAAAQGNAETFATAAATTAQGNAEAYARNASNLSSGTVATALLAGLTATIVTAPLTVGGTSGSMTFTNGLLTAQTPAT